MNKKKLFSGISSAVLILGSLSPMQAFAQNEGETPFQETTSNVVASGKLGENASWNLVENGTLRTLTITGLFNNTNPKWEEGNWPWHSYRETIDKVEFGEGFKVIGSCRAIFSNMKKLTDINFEGFNTSEVTNMSNMFNQCNIIKSLDLSKFNTSNVTNMDGMFLACNQLGSLDLSSFDTSKVTSMNSMFTYCNHLNFLNVSSFNTSEVTNMRFMFGYCSDMSEFDIDNFNTDKVETMELMFYGCSKLTTVDLKNFTGKVVKDFSRMFGGCHALQSLDFTSMLVDHEGDEKPKVDGMFTDGTRPQLVTINQGSQVFLDALMEASPTWHIDKKGPFTKEDILNTVRNRKQTDLELAMDYILYYHSVSNPTDMPANDAKLSESGKCMFKIPSKTPTRSGYTFLGWADTENSTSAKYKAGDTISLDLNRDGQTKNLYAVWRKNSNSSSGSSSSSNRVNLSSVHEMHRLYNPNSGEHFYTKETAERDHLVNVGWNYEGTAWYSPKSSSSPVYRLYNPNAGDHHYTLDAKEKDELVKLGWRYEGIGWYSASKSNGQAIHRQYNPNAVAGAHNFTTDENERDFLINNGWSHEGIAWYGVHPKNIKK